MFRSHLAAAVLVSAVLVPSAAHAGLFGTTDFYSSSPWNSGGSWQTIPAEFVPRYDAGYEAGYPIGYQSGFGEGQVLGRSEGWAHGKAAGHTAGWNEAYPLAFDLGYDEAYPAGHFAGWEGGLGEGFQAGYDYAPVFAEQIFKDWYGGGGASYGSVTISFGHFGDWSLDGIYGTSYTVWRDSLDNDWSKLAYHEGFKVGKDEGYTAGSSAGYETTYGPTYAIAYPIGHQLGVGEGTTAGKRDGLEEGYDEGKGAGYDLGFDAGFTAGIEYRLFDGWYSEPRYALQYSRRSNAGTAASLLAMNAPEPTSALLLAMGGIFASATRRRS